MTSGCSSISSQDQQIYNGGEITGVDTTFFVERDFLTFNTNATITSATFTSADAISFGSLGNDFHFVGDFNFLGVGFSIFGTMTHCFTTDGTIGGNGRIDSVNTLGDTSISPQPSTDSENFLFIGTLTSTGNITYSSSILSSDTYSRLDLGTFATENPILLRIDSSSYSPPELLQENLFILSSNDLIPGNVEEFFTSTIIGEREIIPSNTARSYEVSFVDSSPFSTLDSPSSMLIRAPPDMCCIQASESPLTITEDCICAGDFFAAAPGVSVVNDVLISARSISIDTDSKTIDINATLETFLGDISFSGPNDVFAVLSILDSTLHASSGISAFYGRITISESTLNASTIALGTRRFDSFNGILSAVDSIDISCTSGSDIIGGFINAQEFYVEASTDMFGVTGVHFVNTSITAELIDVRALSTDSSAIILENTPIIGEATFEGLTQLGSSNPAIAIRSGTATFDNVSFFGISQTSVGVLFEDFVTFEGNLSTILGESLGANFTSEGIRFDGPMVARTDLTMNGTGIETGIRLATFSTFSSTTVYLTGAACYNGVEFAGTSTTQGDLIVTGIVQGIGCSGISSGILVSAPMILFGANVHLQGFVASPRAGTGVSIEADIRFDDSMLTIEGESLEEEIYDCIGTCHKGVEIVLATITPEPIIFVCSTIIRGVCRSLECAGVFINAATLVDVIVEGDSPNENAAGTVGVAIGLATLEFCNITGTGTSVVTTTEDLFAGIFAIDVHILQSNITGIATNNGPGLGYGVFLHMLRNMNDSAVVGTVDGGGGNNSYGIFAGSLQDISEKSADPFSALKNEFSHRNSIETRMTDTMVGENSFTGFVTGTNSTALRFEDLDMLGSDLMLSLVGDCTFQGSSKSTGIVLENFSLDLAQNVVVQGSGSIGVQINNSRIVSDVIEVFGSGRNVGILISTMEDSTLMSDHISLDGDCSGGFAVSLIGFGFENKTQGECSIDISGEVRGGPEIDIAAPNIQLNNCSVTIHRKVEFTVSTTVESTEAPRLVMENGAVISGDFFVVHDGTSSFTGDFVASGFLAFVNGPSTLCGTIQAIAFS